tara:strand:+ start:211 stop:336 length:126 start_codon:yes stop_codon:yes gene_type:complete
MLWGAKLLVKLASNAVGGAKLLVKLASKAQKKGALKAPQMC